MMSNSQLSPSSRALSYLPLVKKGENIRSLLQSIPSREHFEVLEYLKRYPRTFLYLQALEVLDLSQEDYGMFVNMVLPHLSSVSQARKLISGFKDGVNNVEILLSTIRRNNYPITKFLLEETQIDPTKQDRECMRVACSRGYTEIFRLIIIDDRFNPSDHHNYLIRLASKKGHSEIVQLLLNDSRVDPSAADNEAIRLASKYGHFGVIQLLLSDPRVDPSANNNEAIRIALKNAHPQVAKLLSEDGRFKSVRSPRDPGLRSIRNVLDPLNLIKSTTNI